MAEIYPLATHRAVEALPDQINKARDSDLLCSATIRVLRSEDERSEPVSATKFGGNGYLRCQTRLIDLGND